MECGSLRSGVRTRVFANVLVAQNGNLRTNVFEGFLQLRQLFHDSLHNIRSPLWNVAVRVHSRLCRARIERVHTTVVLFTRHCEELRAR